MALPDLYLVMGWVIICAFITTFIITTLGLIQVIKPLYMKRLFVMFILETCWAGFFLFYKAFETRKMPCQTALYLGLYLSDFEHGERRNPHQAVKHLLHVLRVENESEGKEKEDATIRLHKLLGYIKQSDNFKLLLRMIHKYRSGHTKYFELAEAYLFYARHSATNTQEINKAALKYYLLFLSTLASEMDELNSVKDAATSRAKELIRIELAEDEYIKSNRGSILAAINSHDRAALRTYSQNISVPDLSKLD